MDAAYDLTTKAALFEISHSGSVVFRYRTGVDAQMSITGQVLSLRIEEDTSSEDALPYTLESAAALSETDLEYAVDFHESGDDTVDYRFQGKFLVLPNYGPF